MLYTHIQAKHSHTVNRGEKRKGRRDFLLMGGGLNFFFAAGGVAQWQSIKLALEPQRKAQSKCSPNMFDRQTCFLSKFLGWPGSMNIPQKRQVPGRERPSSQQAFTTIAAQGTQPSSLSLPMADVLLLAYPRFDIKTKFTGLTPSKFKVSKTHS